MIDSFAFVLESDFGYNIGEAINHFNRSIHIYLKYCVYIRILFLKGSWIKNYFIAAIFVFAFAALWCGIYVGMYFFFITVCIINLLQSYYIFSIKQKLRTLGNGL